MNTEKKKFPLTHPMKDWETPDGMLNEIALRKPKAKDLRVFDEVTGEIASIYALIANLAGITQSQVDDMEISDLIPIIDWVSDFLPKGLAAQDGGKP